jgi:hypothetical protein
MITEPTAPERASRHPYSTRGLSLRLLLLGAMLTSLAVALTGGQPVGASSTDGRERASDSPVLADGKPADGRGTSGQGGPTGGEPAGGRVGGQASDGAPGEVVPAASAPPGFAGGAASGGSAGGPPDDWHLYHHWADPSWPDPGQATGERLNGRGERPRAGAPLPARTSGGYSWEPPVTPTTDPTDSTGWTPSPGDPADPAPGTPTGPPTATWPAPDPAEPHEQPGTPASPPSAGDGTAPGAPGQDQQDGADGPQPTGDPLQRDPVAAGPDDDLGLGDTVDEPPPTPEPTASEQAVPVRAAPADTAPASGYQQTLIYSGLVGLTLAAIGLTMVSLRRRRW